MSPLIRFRMVRSSRSDFMFSRADFSAVTDAIRESISGLPSLNTCWYTYKKIRKLIIILHNWLTIYVSQIKSEDQNQMLQNAVSALCF